ncbi:heavy metal translocating P-type ATPase [Myxococcota bacterium]|nr:heavy metal translocating P-type ATPase [Myxococcota bacterium]
MTSTKPNSPPTDSIAPTADPPAPSNGEIPCDHCGLPVPKGLLRADRTAQYCCNGCEMAALLLNKHGLEALYAQTLQGKPTRPQAAQEPEPYAHFDDAVFQKLYTQPYKNSQLQEIELYLEGIHCAACIWLLEKLPSLLAGVHEARVDFRRSALRLIWNPEHQRLSQIAIFLDRLGYLPHPYRDLYKGSHQQKEDRQMLIRIALTGAVAGNVMLLAFALYSGIFSGMEPAYRNLFRWISFLLTIPSMIWGGSLFFRSAIGALRAQSLHIDQPIALGLAAGFLSGAVNTFRGHGEIYFDSVTALIFLLLVGRWLQRRQQRMAAQATELLYSLSPSRATRINGEQRQSVSVEALQSGDIVEVLAGETFPADGLICQGHTLIDSAILTGESRPTHRNEGDSIFAGTLNLSAVVRVTIQRAGSETRLGQLLREVEETSQKRAPIVQLADRLAGRFVVVVVILAIITAILWSYLDPSLALEHAVALLVICCPCALALATPLAIGVSIGRAARRGILIKGGALLESLATPGTLWLDKTGTLTEGNFRLIQWFGTTRLSDASTPHPYPNTPASSAIFSPIPHPIAELPTEHDGQPSLPALVQALESQIAHPIALALAQALPQSQTTGLSDVQYTVGEGITARFGNDTLAVLSPSAFVRRFGPLPPQAEVTLETITQDALTPALIAVNQQIAAIVALGDPIRKDAASTLQTLQRKGWRIGILSGDHPHVVHAVAKRLQIDLQRCHGGLSPEDKLRIVNQTPAPVVMVGDGVNDAAALSAATVGIGVHGGAEACLAIADIFLSRPGMTPLHELLDGAQHTLHAIRRNLRFSLSYNILGATLAVAGMIGPLAAAILMPLSSLTVVTLSFRAYTFPTTAAVDPNAACPILPPHSALSSS